MPWTHGNNGTGQTILPRKTEILGSHTTTYQALYVNDNFLIKERMDISDIKNEFLIVTRKNRVRGVVERSKSGPFSICGWNSECQGIVGSKPICRKCTT